jgi:hypothetical protein
MNVTPFIWVQNILKQVLRRMFTPRRKKVRMITNSYNEALHNSCTLLHIIREIKPRSVRLAPEMNLGRKIEETLHTEYHVSSSGPLGIVRCKMAEEWLDMNFA